MRDTRIDILRFIGLSMIIFAHVGPPKLFFQLRNFDVPLMVLVSGMSFSLNYNNKSLYFRYIWKRIKRLAFPVWIFITAYFVAQFIVLPDSSELNLNTILCSYALLGGIGYVWIIRVFLLVALISPLLYKINESIKNNVIFFTMLIFLYTVYEAFRYVALPYANGGIGKFIGSILFYISAYGFIFAMGIRLMQMEKKQVVNLMALNLFIFILSFIIMYLHYGKMVATQFYKYPPSIYYFSYALFVSIFLWQYIEFIDKVLLYLKIKRFSLFIANNTIWIYLWHIPFVKFIHTTFFIKYIIVYTSAVLIAYFQTFILNKIILPGIENMSLHKNLKTIFSG